MTSTMEMAWCLVALEGRTVSGGKGTSTANDQRKQELAMQTQAFNTQQKQIADLQKMISPALAGTQGYRSQDLAAFRSNFLNSNNSTFNQAGQQVRQALTSRGNTGSNPVGGDYVRGISSLLGARAGSQSQGLLNIDQQNAQLANQNRWNAANILSGNAATLTGTQGVAGSAASSALDAYMKGANSGFGASFMSSFGGSLGKGLGAGLTGGVGNTMSRVPGFG